MRPANQVSPKNPRNKTHGSIAETGRKKAPLKQIQQLSPDILIENHGSIILLRPVSPVGENWLQQNVISEETQIFGNAVVCEPRYVMDIVLGARAGGVVVR
jgi:hypothetical protein